MVLRFLPVRGTLSQNMPQKRPTTSGREPTSPTSQKTHRKHKSSIQIHRLLSILASRHQSLHLWAVKDHTASAHIVPSTALQRSPDFKTSGKCGRQLSGNDEIWERFLGWKYIYWEKLCKCLSCRLPGYPSQVIFGKHVITRKTSSAAWDCTWSSSPKSWNTTSQELTVLSKCLANNLRLWYMIICRVVCVCLCPEVFGYLKKIRFLPLSLLQTFYVKRLIY